MCENTTHVFVVKAGQGGRPRIRFGKDREEKKQDAVFHAAFTTIPIAPSYMAPARRGRAISLANSSLVCVLIHCE